MNLKSRSIVSLSWTLVAAIIIGLVTCDTTNDSAHKSKSDQRTGKYLELDDLNAFESPQTQLVQENSSGEEVTLNKEEFLKKIHRKKFVKRSTEIGGKTSSSQPEQNRIIRQNQQKRQQQQPKKQRPGFFWTLARVTFETFNDTRSAIQQIRQILNENIVPETPRKPASSSLKKPTTPKSNIVINGTTTTQAPTTTAEPEFKLTWPLLQSLIRRNVKGLVRLYNIEWRDALNQSQKSVQEFRSDLGKQVGIYLQDNPNAY